MFYVYMLLDPRKNNQPFYVGKGTGNRYNDHLLENSDTTINKRKYSTIQKIKSLGLSVEIDIVEYFENEQDAYQFEDILIAQYGRKGIDPNGILTNICMDHHPPRWQTGPNRSAIVEKIKATKSTQDNSHTQETKDKISESLKGKKKPIRTDAHKLALSMSKKGKPLSHTCSTETRQKRSDNQSGKLLSSDTKAKISAALKGRKMSDEHKAKLRAAMIARSSNSNM